MLIFDDGVNLSPTMLPPSRQCVLVDDNAVDNKHFIGFAGQTCYRMGPVVADVASSMWVLLTVITGGHVSTKLAIRY